MNTVQTLDVRQHINNRKMSGYQWLCSSSASSS
jgi:hypothetical protein